MTTPLHLLLIEDSDDDAMLVLRELKRGGFDVTYERVETAETMTAALARGAWDCVISDFALPHFNGLAALELYRESGLDLPFILVSGTIGEETAVTMMKTGAHDFVMKDKLGRLPAAIERELREAEMRRERRRAEGALRESDERFRSVAQSASDAIIVADSSGIILSWNKGAQAMFGHSEGEALGRPVAILMPERYREAHRQGLERIRATGQTRYIGQTLELVGLRKDGSEFPLEMSISSWQAGAETFYSGIIRDITERKRAEEQIRRNAARAEALARTAARLNAQLDLQATLKAVCEEAARALNAPAAGITLYDEKRDALDLAAAFGLPPEYVERHLPTPRAIFDEYVRQAGRLIVAPDAQAIPGLPNAELYARHNVRTIAVAGMFREGELFGTLNVYTFGEPRAFSEDELALLQGLADQAAQAIANARLFEHLQRRVGELSVLSEMDRQMAASLHVRDILDFAVKTIPRIIGAEACSLLLWDERKQVLITQAVEGWPAESVGQARYRQGEGLAGWVFLERRAANVPNVAADTRWKDKYGEDEKLPSGQVRCALTVPLILGDKTLGVLDVVNKINDGRRPAGEEAPGAAFAEADEALLTSVATQMAVALENARLYQDVRSLSVATIRCLATAIDARDPYTRGHSEGVTRVAVQLARELDWGGADLEMLEFAALLHDVGKIGVPDEILRKPGALTPDEWGVMRLHPYHSRQIVKPVESLQRILPWIYHHHEKWDGTGYPDGIKGEAIPLAARIIAVADVWDALSSDRPYRKAWPEEKAREHIKAGSGSHFDPGAVETFLRLTSGTDERT